MRSGAMFVIVSLLIGGANTVLGQELEEEAQAEQPSAQMEESAADQPIVLEVAHGLDLLNDQIAQQQELLKTAQTERERQLIHNHIRLLQKERRSLESLLHKLIGPRLDVLEAAREQRRELEYERIQKQLEREERFPP